MARAAIISEIYFGICSSANGVASIPHKTFVMLDAVFAQELAVFFLKGAAAMVFLLGVHVFEEGRQSSLGLTENAP